jgi:hypothetical protein
MFYTDSSLVKRGGEKNMVVGVSNKRHVPAQSLKLVHPQPLRPVQHLSVKRPQKAKEPRAESERSRQYTPNQWPRNGGLKVEVASLSYHSASTRTWSVRGQTEEQAEHSKSPALHSIPPF